jgi:hypothetical protein
LGPLGTSATTGLLYLPWVIEMMENLVERRLAGETGVLREKPAPASLCPPQIPLARLGHSGGKPATNRLSYGAASHNDYYVLRCSTISRRQKSQEMFSFTKVWNIIINVEDEDPYWK